MSVAARASSSYGGFMLDSTLGAAVAAAYGLGGAATLRGPVARGQRGLVWRLETPAGAFAVKDPLEPMSADDAEADAAYQEVVQAAGVPMPRVVRSRSGAVCTEVEGHQVRVYEWMDVAGPERSLDPAEVGRVVAAVHRVHVPASSPMDTWYTTPVGLEAWEDLCERLEAGRAPFTHELTALVPNLGRLEALIGPMTAEQWCHSDLWSDNVLPRLPRPGSGVAVLDWENCGPGVPTQELALVLYDFGLGDPDRERALCTAYVGAGGPGRLTGPSDFAVLAAQLGHIVEAGCEGWLASSSDAGRDHHEAWVREYLDDPLTERRIDAILAAIRG